MSDDLASNVSEPALAALLSRSPGRPPQVIVGGGVDQPRAFSCRAATTVPDADLAKLLRGRKADLPVLVTAKVGATLARAVRERPPRLLVVTGPLASDTAEQLRSVDGMDLLGPDATLRVGKGTLLTCAANREELDGLRRALDDGAERLTLCPTPPWLPRWLAADVLGDVIAVGYVPLRALSLGWARWVSARAPRHALVPLGPPVARVDHPGDSSLAPAVAAHALERETGPVFPSPRVLASIARGFSAPDAERDPTEDDIGMWTQARRALPNAGAVIGMDAPDLRLAIEAPTAAFLAQRALLRAERSRQLVRDTAVVVPEPDGAALSRSREIMLGAAQALSDQESKVVLRGFGLDVTRQAVAASASGASQFAETIGMPVVLKAVSPDLRRKQEIGAVVLGLRTAAAVRRGYAKIVAAVEERAPTARLDGVVVAEMLGPGLDVHCGIVRLAGGELAIHGRALAAEVPIEPTLVLSPLPAADAVRLAHSILATVPVPALRRSSDPEVGPLATVLLQLDRLAREHGDRLRAVDLAPARLVDGRGWVVLDASIIQRPHLEGL